MKKINKIKYINGALLTLLLLASSCLDQIELDIPKGFDETLIIQGRLAKGNPSSFSLNVSRLFDFTVESLERVNVRIVTLEDDSGTLIEIPRTGTGIYNATIPQSVLSVETGKSYQVKLTTFDGRSYESTFEPLLPVPQIDSIKYTYVERENVFADGVQTSRDSAIRFFVDTQLEAPNSNQRIDLKWDVRRMFQISDTPIEFGIEQKTCYVTEETDIPNLKVFGADDFSGTSLTDFQIFDQKIDFHLSEGYFFELIQSSLSPGAFTYFDQIAQTLERDGNMFETPAGRLSTNFTNLTDSTQETFGYFYVTQSDTSRIYVSPEFARFPMMRCPPTEPPPPDGGCADALCCDCLSAPISTTIRPGFWPPE